jgi:hypothetical protein
MERPDQTEVRGVEKTLNLSTQYSMYPNIIIVRDLTF